MRRMTPRQTTSGGARLAMRASVLLAAAGLVAGCGGSAGPSAARPSGTGAGANPSGPAAGSSAPSSETSAPSGGRPTRARFDPQSFGTPGRGPNRWLPLAPGTQWVREGATDVGHRRVPHRVVSTVTSVSKTVDGVRTIAVYDLDVDAGQVTQESLDYYAEDDAANVWYLGSYTEQVEGGRYVSVQDAWLAGVDGGRPGILMPGEPRTGTPPFSIARPPGEDGDVAQVVKTGQRTCVPFRCFTGVLVVREGKSSAPDNEFKYYAPGVGQVLNTPRSASQHRDLEKLVNLTRLSAAGLDEVNAAALKLDRHARTQKPKVFGGSSPAAVL